MSKRRPWSLTNILALAVVGAMAVYAIGCGPACKDDQTLVGEACVGIEGAECPDGWDSSCLDDLVCEQIRDVQMCIPQYTSESIVEALGYRVKFGETRTTGFLYFPDDQTGKSVIVEAKDQFGEPVNNVNVSFWDGNSFGVFQAQHSSFTPLFVISPSDLTFKTSSQDNVQELILNTAPWTVDVYDRNPERQTADNFTTTHKDLMKYEGCVQRETLESMGTYRTFLFTLTESNPVTAVVNTTYSARDNLVQILTRAGVVNSGECAAVHQYSLIPEDHPATSGLIFNTCVEYLSEEILGNHTDDDCDGQIDETSDDTCT
ncbi:MAG: hypothetical protein ABIH82_03150, partial [Candidatus Woesearchaeota archaeon]